MIKTNIEEPGFKPGDPRPFGYCAFFDWADVQMKAGLKQTRCPQCIRWNFPQEFSTQTIEVGSRKKMQVLICLDCANGITT